MTVLWVCDAILLTVGIVMLGYGLNGYYRPRPGQIDVRRHHARKRHPSRRRDAYAPTVVVDGITIPSAKLAALCEPKAPRP